MCCRDELKTQLSQLTSDLSLLKASFQSLQDFIQLPLVFMWQHQLTSVMQQALAHELSSLPQSLSTKSGQQRLPSPASQSANHYSQLFEQSAAGRTTHQAPAAMEPAKDTQLPHAAAVEAETAMVSTELSHSSGREVQDQPASHRLQTLPEQELAAHSYGHTESESMPDRASRQAVPGQALAQSPGQTHPAGLPHRASFGRLPQKAMDSGLPNQAMPAQATFLRACVSELLRLTHPTQSQYQPLLCGWYTAGELACPV